MLRRLVASNFRSSSSRTTMMYRLHLLKLTNPSTSSDADLKQQLFLIVLLN
jgi:hypothetical protein